MASLPSFRSFGPIGSSGSSSPTEPPSNYLVQPVATRAPDAVPAPPNRIPPPVPPHQPMPNQRPGAGIFHRPPIPRVPVQGLDNFSKTESKSEKDDIQQNPTETPYISVWDRAVASLREKKSDSLLILEKNLEDLDYKDSLAGNIGGMLEARYEKIRATDGISQSRTRKVFSRTAKFISSTKDLGMGLSRLDPNRIAPIVLGGVYCLAQCIDGATEISLVAIKATMDIAELFALWNCLEERQMKKQHNKELQGLYDELSEEVARMYQVAIRLLGTLMKYFDSRWKRTMAVLVPEKSEWEKLKDELKLYETRCNSIKSRIATVKDSQERDSKILKWISPHDIHKSYKSVQERTKMDKQYRNRCRWLIETSEFELWYSLQTTTVLWLNGTIGTGKTTLMVRAIREIERSSMVEIEAKPFAKFFFEKARSSSDSLLSIETCLRSLVRQLSWNHATSNIEPVSERKYNEFQDDHADDSSLTTGECLHLLIDLISEKDVYIMIDAIDECNDAEGLLETLKELMILLNERKKRRGYLHLMLCGRSYLPVSDYFEKCFTILATSADSLKDQYFFIDREIDRTKKIKSGSLFVTSGKNFPERLGRILKKKGKGIFRWIEIKIEYFRKHHFRDTREIEEQLDQLETSTKEPELYDEYKRLLNLLSARQRACATTMLKFVASSFWPLSAVSVAQAITAQGFGTSNSDITAEDVRRLLVGFISEVPAQPQLPFSIINWFYENERLLPRFEIPRYTDDGDNFVLELGHASVLEYLVESMDKRTTADDFSTSAQHAEAALLCFASISNWHRLESTSNFPSILLSDGISIEGYRKGLSDLFYYSCKTWPQHCKRAFPGDNSTHVIEKTRDFILSDSYLTWNSAIRGIQRRKWGSSQIANEQNSVWHDPKLRMPGFVIIINGLTELFKFLEIHDIVSLSDNNGIGQDLFTVAVQFSKPGVMGHILQLFPGPVRWNGEWRPLYLAATKLHIEAVRALLDSRQDSALDTKSITKALQEAILEMSIYLDEDEVGILLWPIINLLASKGDTSKLPYWQRREIERRVC